MGRDPLKVAIVAGLNLADELVRRPASAAPPTVPGQEETAAGDGATAGGAATAGDADRIAARLIQEIDRALEPEP